MVCKQLINEQVLENITEPRSILKAIKQWRLMALSHLTHDVTPIGYRGQKYYREVREPRKKV